MTIVFNRMVAKSVMVRIDVIERSFAKRHHINKDIHFFALEDALDEGEEMVVILR